MTDPKPQTPTPPDPDGVRVVAGNRGDAVRTRVLQGLALFLVAGCVGYVVAPRARPESARVAPTPQDRLVEEAFREDQEESAVEKASVAPSANSAPASAATLSSRPLTPRRKASHRASQDPPEEPSDMPEPGESMQKVTAGEYIQALHDAGIYEGIGAFPPPGTKPNLEGLAVPPDYEVPEGYVRHHQTTDDGQDIEPILMYSPDYEFFDVDGNPIEIPEDRVVPPEHAPAGVPVRIIEIPAPRQPEGLGR